MLRAEWAKGTQHSAPSTQHSTSPIINGNPTQHSALPSAPNVLPTPIVLGPIPQFITHPLLNIAPVLPSACDSTSMGTIGPAQEPELLNCLADIEFDTSSCPWFTTPSKP